MKYDVGDIVLVRAESYPHLDGAIGEMHAFVVMGIAGDDVDLILIDYISLMITSKEKDKPYYEPIESTKETNLKLNSLVKCNYLYTVNEDDIIWKIGRTSEENCAKYLELYELAKKNGRAQGDT